MFTGNSGAEQKPKRKPRGRPFAPGQSGNPGGQSAEEAEARAKLRAALCGEWQEIHEALMLLVKAGNAPAVIYAHKHVAGEAMAEQARQDEDEESGIAALTSEEARDYLALCLKVSDAAKTKALAQAANQGTH